MINSKLGDTHQWLIKSAPHQNRSHLNRSTLDAKCPITMDHLVRDGNQTRSGKRPLTNTMIVTTAALPMAKSTQLILAHGHHLSIA